MQQANYYTPQSLLHFVLWPLYYKPPVCSRKVYMYYTVSELGVFILGMKQYCCAHANFSVTHRLLAEFELTAQFN